MRGDPPRNTQAFLSFVFGRPLLGWWGTSEAKPARNTSGQCFEWVRGGCECRTRRQTSYIDEATGSDASSPSRVAPTPGPRGSRVLREGLTATGVRHGEYGRCAPCLPGSCRSLCMAMERRSTHALRFECQPFYCGVDSALVGRFCPRSIEIARCLVEALAKRPCRCYAAS